MKIEGIAALSKGLKASHWSQTEWHVKNEGKHNFFISNIAKIITEDYVGVLGQLLFIEEQEPWLSRLIYNLRDSSQLPHFRSPK
jgi:hypothetical protein